MIRHTQRWAVSAVLAAVVSGCYSSGELGHTMGSWEGSSFEDVTAAWGQPDNCETTEGRRICSWNDMVSGYSLSAARTCVRSLEIDPSGYVTGWRWRGDYCFATAERVLARAPSDRPGALDADSDDTDSVEVALTQPAE